VIPRVQNKNTSTNANAGIKEKHYIEMSGILFPAKYEACASTNKIYFNTASIMYQCTYCHTERSVIY
jgi:hypothetical protein